MVSHLNSFKYMEMDGEFIETPCQAFEVVPPMVVATKCSSDVSKDVKVMLKMVSFKDARAAVEEGSCDTWGQLLEIPFKANKFGLGFTVKAQKEVKHARARKPPLRIGRHKVNIVGDSDEEATFEDWMYLTTIELKNCNAKDFVPISLIEQ